MTDIISPTGRIVFNDLPARAATTCDFETRPSCDIGTIDYSEIELRTMALGHNKQAEFCAQMAAYNTGDVELVRRVMQREVIRLMGVPAERLNRRQRRAKNAKARRP